MYVCANAQSSCTDGDSCETNQLIWLSMKSVDLPMGAACHFDPFFIAVGAHVAVVKTHA
jgi:hypothetical protein